RVRGHRDAPPWHWQRAAGRSRIARVMDRSFGLPAARRGGRAQRGCGWFLRRVLVTLGLAVVLTACGGHSSLSRNDTVAAVIKGLDNPFFATMRDGLVSTAKQHKVRITVQAAAGLQDTAGQASELEA